MGGLLGLFWIMEDGSHVVNVLPGGYTYIDCYSSLASVPTRVPYHSSLSRCNCGAVLKISKYEVAFNQLLMASD
jgi:hypothetical protein